MAQGNLLLHSFLHSKWGRAGTRRVSQRVERRRRRASRAGTRVRKVLTRRCSRRPARPARRRWFWTPGRRRRQRPRLGRCGGCRVLRIKTLFGCWSPGRILCQPPRPSRCGGCRVSEVSLVPEHPGQNSIIGQGAHLGTCGASWAHAELPGKCVLRVMNPLRSSLNPGSGRRARLGRSQRLVQRRNSPWPCRRRMPTTRSRTSRRPSSPQGARRRSSARATMRATRRPHLVCRPYTFSAISKYLSVGVSEALHRIGCLFGDLNSDAACDRWQATGPFLHQQDASKGH